MEGKDTLKNLISLIKIFQEVPELFAKKLLEHDALNENFLRILSNNSKLSDLSLNPSNYKNVKKVFYSIEDINKFYNQFFKQDLYDKKELETLSIYDARTDEEALIIQLENAIKSEHYILAAKINDYMKLLNIDYTPKL